MCLDVPEVEDKVTWDKLRAQQTFAGAPDTGFQSMNRTILLALGVVLFVVGLGVSYSEWDSGIQPWGQLLTDNFLFARSLPFTIGLGIVVGFWRASGWRWGTERRASDGAIRRFAPRHRLAARPGRRCAGRADCHRRLAVPQGSAGRRLARLYGHGVPHPLHRRVAPDLRHGGVS